MTDNVTEADREAACRAWTGASARWNIEVMAGQHDDHPLVLSFAKHRIQSTAELQKECERIQSEASQAISGHMTQLSKSNAEIERLTGLLRELSDTADALNGSIDEQTYDEKLSLQDWSDDHEFEVVVTAKQDRALNSAIYRAQQELKRIDTLLTPEQQDG